MSRFIPYLVNLASDEAPKFVPINDQVMGGRSASRFRLTREGTGVFEGVVSLENNGGFASVRTGIDNTDLSGLMGVRLRIRGDGHRYRLSLRNDRKRSGLNHMHEFETRPGEWEELVLPFHGFWASIRGYRPPDAPPLDPSRIRQVGLMIADKQAGPFRLELAWIRGERDLAEGGETV